MLAKEKMQELNQLVGLLTDSEQEALLEALKKQLLLRKAQQLKVSVLPNPIKMQDIVEEIRKVRTKKP